jgi:hypothetical protein
MTFETLTDIFAVIGAAACLWSGVVLVGRMLGRIEGRSEATGQEAEVGGRSLPVSPPAEEGVPAEHVAAIAAAVAACGHRVVHIDPAGGTAWVSEGRWIHQTSHRTH